MDDKCLKKFRAGSREAVLSIRHFDVTCLRDPHQLPVSNYWRGIGPTCTALRISNSSGGFLVIEVQVVWQLLRQFAVPAPTLNLATTVDCSQK